MFGGDVMLGRGVGTCIERYGMTYPLGPVASLMRDADLTIVNLECAITASEDLWRGPPKAFYFGAPPQAVDTLTDAGVDMVSLANNHTLDFDVEGLYQTLNFLRAHGIAFAGAGEESREAVAPAVIARQGIKFGMVAFCDHQQDFAADENQPGIAWIDLDNETATLGVWQRSLQRLQAAGVDWPILSLHWGPNQVAHPSVQFQRLAHAAIDGGWKILFGHSAHVFHGIEIFRGCPILYAAGDLVDDYRVDPDFRNDHQLLIEMVCDRTQAHQIRLHPVIIDRCQTRPATGASRDEIVRRMTQQCQALGSVLLPDDLSIRITS
jgi:poly-gamma-glutamate synthesis protein (capsule biosynthesis protein)